ncbi:MAG: hypothetical protein IJS32_09450 [Kiritimatiellae bacterium]|nr:hypothetical protein [Kiritimatiellia bacterium]
MSSFRRVLALRARRFRRDDSGQALLAVGILSLALLLFATSVFPIGGAVRRRIRAQTAADAAALATGIWAARGCNMVNASNALSYDIHVVYHLIINGITIKWIAKIAKDCSQLPWGPIVAIGDWFEGRKEIATWWANLGFANDYVDAGVLAATPGYDHLALSEASEVARCMGADKIGEAEMKDIFSSLGVAAPSEGYSKLKTELDKWYGTGTVLNSLRDFVRNALAIVPALGKVLSKVADGLLPNPKKEIDLYCWPLAPDVRPHKAWEISRLVEWPTGNDTYPPEAGRTVFLRASPLHTAAYDPFALDMVFLKFFSWNAKYARLAGEADGTEKDLEKSGNCRFTTAVRFGATKKEDSWFPSLAKLWYGGENGVTAVSSVRLKGDRLTDAGCKTDHRIYFTMGILAVPIWPIPLIRAPAYGGEFDYEPCPVVFRDSWKAKEVSGESKLIFH